MYKNETLGKSQKSMFVLVSIKLIVVHIGQQEFQLKIKRQLRLQQKKQEWSNLTGFIMDLVDNFS